MAIKSKSFNKKLARARRWSDFWFKLFKLGFMRRILKKILKQTTIKNNFKDVNKLQIFPSDFRKLSDEQIERGLDMFVKRCELASWSHIKEQNADGYLVVFSSENRSQERILNRIPEEINLNEINLEPLPQKEQEKPAELQEQLTQEPEELPAEKMLDAQIPVHAKQPAEPTDDEDYSKPF